MLYNINTKQTRTSKPQRVKLDGGIISNPNASQLSRAGWVDAKVINTVPAGNVKTGIRRVDDGSKNCELEYTYTPDLRAVEIAKVDDALDDYDVATAGTKPLASQLAMITALKSIWKIVKGDA